MFLPFNLEFLDAEKFFSATRSTAIGFLLGWLLIVNSQTPQPKLPQRWCLVRLATAVDMARVIYR